jgi:serine/threonine protein kinase
VLNLTINDFEFIKPITRGGFARVYLAKKKKTGDMYAIKVMSKAEMIKKVLKDLYPCRSHRVHLPCMTLLTSSSCACVISFPYIRIKSIE